LLPSAPVGRRLVIAYAGKTADRPETHRENESNAASEIARKPGTTLVAKWWSEFNDDFRPHEIPYFQKLDGTLESEEDHTLDIGLYFENELLLMLERTGFESIVVHGEHTEAEATSDDDFLVFVAKR